MDIAIAALRQNTDLIVPEAGSPERIDRPFSFVAIGKNSNYSQVIVICRHSSIGSHLYLRIWSPADAGHPGVFRIGRGRVTA
jgi:hypothetical protein